MRPRTERTDYSAPASQQVEVFGAASDILPYDRPAVTRTLTTRPVTFTCQQCGQNLTQERYPGPTPRYCGPRCQEAATAERRREQTRERVQRYRARQRSGR